MEEMGEGKEMGTYSCFSNNALSELIEVEEELFNSNPILCNLCLKVLFDIKFDVHERFMFLLG
jgi:hypothetical protein